MKFFRTEFFTVPQFRKLETIKSEQSNSSFVIDRSIIIKNYRYLQSGENPDLEMTMALTIKSGFRNVPKPMGYIVYEGEGMNLYTASVSEFLAGSMDSWTYYTDLFKSMIEKNGYNKSFMEYIMELAEKLGRLTGEMHDSLSLVNDDAFSPEPLQMSDLEDIIRGSMEYITASLDLLKPIMEKNMPYIEKIEKIARNGYLDDLASRMLSGISASGLKRIRVHGDYHLGQILIWNDSFYIIDFEGEPVRSMEERRRKQSPMKDLAGIIRSMDYLVSQVALKTGNQDLATEKDTLLDQVRKKLTDSYIDAFIGYENILPGDPDMFNTLLDIYILDKSSYELIYEINNRPSWVEIPLMPVLGILENIENTKRS
jgi:trehalose synthase-fused probable maltokinase